jgi:hypothetical protein
MKLFSPIAAICFACSVLLFSCDKEYSVEDNTKVVGEGTAEGILGSGTAGDCSNTQKFGVYAQGLTTDSSNKVLVELNVTTPGTYNISTDTVNGVYFSKTGTITITGVTSILLAATGTPASTGSFAYTVKFKGTVCSFSIDVLAVAPSNGTDYFPVTANSYWKYLSANPAAGPQDTSRNTSTGNIFTILGNNYFLFAKSDASGTDSLFFRKSGGEYQQFADLDIAGIADSVVAADYTFLKDNVPVGTTWESSEGDATVASVPVKIKLKLTISSKNTSVQVGNAVFKDVIKVTTAEQVNQSAGYSTVFSYETWYAKGIGVINIVAAAPLYGFLVQQYQVF